MRLGPGETVNPAPSGADIPGTGDGSGTEENPVADETKTSEDALILSHLDLVGKVLGRVAAMYPAHVDRRDLWNAGALGLVEAARRFDPATGVPFERYASIRIRGAIIDSTRHRDWASRSVRRRHRELLEAEDALTGADGSPSDDELAECLGVTPEELVRIRARSREALLVYLDREADAEGGTLSEILPDDDPLVRPEEALERQELLGTLREAIDALDGVHGEVIRRHYFDGELLQQIADDLGVTLARVSQIRTEALNAIRAWFGNLYEGVPHVPDGSPGKRARHAYVAQLAERSTWRSRLGEPPRPSAVPSGGPGG